MPTDIPNFVSNLTIGSALALIFYLVVKQILSNNRETINTLLKENKEQREEFTKIISNHMHSEAEVMARLINAVENLDRNILRLSDKLKRGLTKRDKNATI